MNAAVHAHTTTRQTAPRCVIFILLLIAGMLCSCDSRDKAQVITLRFWNPFSGPDGRTMLRIVKQFQAENPDIRVTVQRMHFGTYYNKLFVAGIGGRAPDVFISHRWALPRFVSAGFARPADDLLGKSADQLDPNDFRSEEHTSELQSQSNLVCRLLLEKKNVPPPAMA